MGGGKGSSTPPPAPDYTPIASADENIANVQMALGANQLAFAQQQYADQKPITDAFMNSMIANTNQQTTNAQNMENEYTSVYQPLQNQFVQTAENYNNPDRATQQAGAAMGDVANQMDSARAASLQNLESYGIDPSQTRFGALDLGTRISQAAATSAAGTQSRLNTEATGLGLVGSAINMGQGLPANVTSAYSGATNSGASAVNAGNATTATAMNAMGTPTSYMNLSGGNYSNAANTMNMGFNDALGSARLSADESMNASNGIGSLVGGALGIGMIAKGLGQ